MCSSGFVTAVRGPKRRDCSGHSEQWLLLRRTLSRGEFAQLAGGVATGGPDMSFRCVATVYRNELSDEVMDMVLDRLSEAPPETNISLDHYMHGEVCRVASDSTAFPFANPAAFTFVLGWIGKIRPRRSAACSGPTKPGSCYDPRQGNGFMPITRAIPAKARLRRSSAPIFRA